MKTQIRTISLPLLNPRITAGVKVSEQTIKALSSDSG